MILDDNMIISATIGAVRTLKDENGIGFRRYSEEQETAFALNNKYFPSPEFDRYFYNNCLNSIGIYLDFVTDAISVEITRGNVGKRKAFCDVFADGKRIRSWNGEKTAISFAEKKERRITVYLASGREYISEIMLGGASLFRPYFKQGTDILFLGDSIFQGVGAVRPSVTMPTVIGRRLDARILNQGNSGHVYDENTIEKICEPKLIIMGYGCNDRDRKSEDDFYNDTLAYAKKVRRLWKDVPAAGVLPVYCFADDEPDYDKRYRKYDELLREAYRAADMAVIEGSELIPHDRKYFNPDSHPNNKGYLIFGNRLAKILIETGLYKK